MAEKPGVLRETDEEARHLARVLLRGARFGALAVLEPDTGAPFASRVLVGIDTDGSPVTLVSTLSTHTAGLDGDGRASLLVGEPGKGDPLAHPRLTVQCSAERIDRDGPAHARMRQRFIRRHSKSELYVDFGDFAFFRLAPASASLNGGFGRAYRLSAADLAIRSPAIEEIAAAEEGEMQHANTDHRDAIAALARHFGGVPGGSWAMCGLDAAGFDLQSGDRLVRIEFLRTLESAAEIRTVLGQTYKLAR